MEYYSAHTEERLDNFDMHFDDERPPIYNAEDYALHLRKYNKMTGGQLYSVGGKEGRAAEKAHRVRSSGGRREAAESHQGEAGFSEMALRQFSTVSQLLQKLRTDLHLSFHSFLKEFISEPNDGVTLLLDLLKLIQLSQTSTNSNQKPSQEENSGSRHQVLKRALSDEHQALLCLKLCSEAEDGALKMAEHPSGLFTVSVCVMSNFSKSRVLALQVLARMCALPTGHRMVADAVSMLRLRFGEPVRFKFLIGMLNSFNSQPFQLACLGFLNTFLGSAGSPRDRVHIQCELEEAGLDIGLVAKMNSQNGAAGSGELKEEIKAWNRAYIDVDHLLTANRELVREVEAARLEVLGLRERLVAAEAAGGGLGHHCLEDTQRWVEGSSDQGRREEDASNMNYRSVNTVIISCNEAPEGGRAVRRAKFPGPGRARSRVRVTAADTSEESDKSSSSGQGGGREERPAAEEEAAVPGARHQVRHLPVRPAEHRPEGLPPAQALGARPGPALPTALNRCKSFFGMRSDAWPPRAEGEPRAAGHDSFVLKGDSGGPGGRSVKRSKSMDILRSRMLRRPGRREAGEEMVGVDRENPYRNRNEYVSNWAKEAFFSDNMYSEDVAEAPQAQQSFYSLYFPGDPSQRPAAVQEPESHYLSMTNNNSLPAASCRAADRNANTARSGAPAKFVESEYY